MALISKQEEISDATVQNCKTLKDALNLCIMVSGLSVKEVAYHLGYEEHPEQLSRMLNTGAHFPPEKIDQLMDVCGNEVPLRWQVLKRGYGTYRLKNTRWSWKMTNCARSLNSRGGSMQRY